MTAKKKSSTTPPPKKKASAAKRSTAGPRLEFAAGVRAEMIRIYKETRSRKLEPEMASKLVYILREIQALNQSSSVEERIKALEEKLNA